MDGRRFDELTRALGALATRRGAIGAAVGAVAGALGFAEAEAQERGGKGEKGKCRRPGAKCGRGDTCCGGRCRKGRCVCAKNRKRCGNRCIGKRACCTNGKPGCPAGQRCGQDGRCRRPGCSPQPNPCGDRTCGTVKDSCGNDVNCGSCPSGQSCGPNGQCAAGCTPNCAGKQCGDNGCGGSCGTCGANETCTAQGQCVCPTEMCGPAGSRVCCPDGQVCRSQQCVPSTCANTCSGCCTGETCTENPTATACGVDGKTCKNCKELKGPNATCDANGQCQCTPDTCETLGKECGTWDDGCGGTVTCGTAQGECRTMQCHTATCKPNGTCDYAAANKGHACTPEGDAADSGLCLGDGSCQRLSNATAACNSADACGYLPLTYCGPGGPNDESCVCYSTVEGGGMCVRRASGCQPNEDPSGCQNFCPALPSEQNPNPIGARPECNTSDECADPDAVCVRLDQDPGSQPNCCGGGRAKKGFCVDKSASCYA